MLALLRKRTFAGEALKRIRFTEIDAQYRQPSTPHKRSAKFPKESNHDYSSTGRNGRRGRDPFDDLKAQLVESLHESGIRTPTEVQSQLLHCYMTTTKDLLVQAKTGTGKSLGYLIALLNQSPIPSTAAIAHYEPRNLVVVPNVALALQLYRWSHMLTRTNSHVKLLIPYVDESVEKSSVTPGASHILVGTPELLRLELAKNSLRPSMLSTIVLDEADYLIKSLKQHATLNERQNRIKHPAPTLTLMRELLGITKTKPRLVVTSATLNRLSRIDLQRHGIVSKDDYKFIRDQQDEDRLATCPAHICHHHRLIEDDNKELLVALTNVFDRHPGEAGIIFLPAAKSKSGFREWLAGSLRKDLSLAYLHENSSPKPGTLLIGSDNDSRGIDLPSVSFVIVLDLPVTPTAYLHMAGRVGRTGQRDAGAVYTLLGVEGDLERFTTRMSILRLTSIPF